MTKNQNTKGQAPWEWKVALFRKKFAAREDRFYKKRFGTFPEDDPETGLRRWVEKPTFMLACDNYGSQEHCLITKHTGGCGACTKRVYSSLTDTAVSRHIFGEDQLCLITLRDDGIRFGAIDFDNSLSDGLNGIFEDARTVRQYCMSIGVPCYIARSSNKGYHLYFFFKETIAAHLFTSFARHLLKVHDYYSKHMYNPQLSVPEVFPKQTTYRETANGNGIRVPMSEPDMKRGKNCFVDDEGAAIPFEKQWDYLNETEDNDPVKFSEILTNHKVEILLAPASKDSDEARKAEARANGEDDTIRKQSGSFWNIVAGCPAMMEYWAKDADGSYAWDKSNPKGLFNDARVSSMNLALATTDGEEIITKRWPTEMTKRQIEGAKRSGYKPTRCRWMQERGVCHVGKHPKSACGTFCMEKMPPTKMVEGKLVVNQDKLPEDQWNEPSPYRYAHNTHMSVDEIIERLHILFADRKAGSGEDKLDEKGRPIINGSFKPDNLEEMRELLFKKIGFLEELNVKKVRDRVLGQKWMTAKNFDEYLRMVKKATSEAVLEKARATQKSFMSKNDEIFLEGHCLVKKWTDPKGQPQKTKLTDFWIELIEDRSFIHLKSAGEESIADQNIADREFIVTMHCEKDKYTFPLKLAEMSSDSKFFNALIRGSGVDFIASRGDYDIIRNSISKFSENVRRKKVVYDIGYYRLKENSTSTPVDKWIMPSVIVTKEGISENNEYQVVHDADICRPLDFRNITDSEVLKDLGRHIANEFFNCNNPVLTQTMFAHAMAATVVERLAAITGYHNAPVLWVAGDYGQGKSFIAHSVQDFFGHFTKMNTKINSDGSPKSWTAAANKYRHSFMLVDDVKDSIKKDKTQVIQFVQGAYDRNVRTAMKRDGSNREHADKVRGLVCVTGEDYPEQEASAISRLLLLDVDVTVRRDFGARVMERRGQYCGFTPHVIHFWMNLTDEEIKNIWDQYYNYFYASADAAAEKQNAGRICENLTLNMVGFHLGIETMYAKGSISDVQREELLRQHQMNLMILKSQVMVKVSENRGSEVFLRYLRELIANPQQYHITNWPGLEAYDHRNSRSIGFYEKETNTVFLMLETAVAAVASLANPTGAIIQSKTQISRQLYNDGYLEIPTGIDRSSESKYTVRRRNPISKVVTRVTPIKASAIGLDMVSEQATKKDMPPGVIRKMASSDDGFPIN